MRKKKIWIIILGMVGMLCFTACGKREHKVVYKYPDEEVFPDFKIKKCEYTDKTFQMSYETDLEMKDYQVTCFDKDFQALTGEYTYEFSKGKLTVVADFAKNISGLYLSNPKTDVSYQLRYLDSPQFAGVSEVLVYDVGIEEYGNQEAFYTKEELAKREEHKKNAEQESSDTFALLKGTWISEDEMQKYQFRKEETGYIMVSGWYEEEFGEWNFYEDYPQSFFQTKDVEGTEITVSFGNDCADQYFIYLEKEDRLKDPYTDVCYKKENEKEE